MSELKFNYVTSAAEKMYSAVAAVRCKFLFMLYVLVVAIAMSACGNENSGKQNKMPGVGESGIILGAAIGAPMLAEADYRTALGQWFGGMVPENAMKWDALQPVEGSFDFSDADVIVAHGQENSKYLRGHTLLWHAQLPAWVLAKTKPELDVILATHVNTVVGRYRGRIAAWDVANEVIKSSSYGLRNRTEMIDGPDYSPWAGSASDDTLIRKAFILAAAADPDALLFINDNNPYGSDPTWAQWNQDIADLLYAYVQQWVADGVPVHGVGMQLHLDESAPPDFAMIESDVVRYGSLGLIVHFTEVDIRIAEPVTEEKLRHQAEMYGELAGIAKRHSAIVRAVFTWGITDKYSWIPLYFPGCGSGLLFDEFYQPKPAYLSLRDILQL